MRVFRRLAALLMAMMMLCSTAQADMPLLQHAQGWSLAQTPLEIMLSADVTAHLPYDDNRMSMLKAITDLLSMRLTAGQDEGSVTVYAGNTQLVALAYRGSEVQLSSIPGVSFVSENDPMGKLIGTSTVSDFSLYGIDGSGKTLLEDGWDLMNSILPDIEKYGKRTKSNTKVTDMGTASYRVDYTIPDNASEALKEVLLSHCPEGWLREIIEGLSFSGNHTVRLYLNANEVPLRMEYNGSCGPEGNLRKVNLIWRARRDSTAYRDEITLTSPAKTGTNKNDLTFKRVTRKNKAGAIETSGEFTYTVTSDKQTTALKGDFDLKNAFTDTSDVISGSLTVQQKLPGDTSFESLTFEPDLTISGTQDQPSITGSVNVTGMLGKGVTEQANVKISVIRSSGTPWDDHETKIDLDALTPDGLSDVQQRVAASTATAVVRPLILLLGESAGWFFQDMSPEAIAEVIDAASSILVIE